MAIDRKEVEEVLNLKINGGILFSRCVGYSSTSLQSILSEHDIDAIPAKWTDAEVQKLLPYITNQEMKSFALEIAQEGFSKTWTKEELAKLLQKYPDIQSGVAFFLGVELCKMADIYDPSLSDDFGVSENMEPDAAVRKILSNISDGIFNGDKMEQRSKIMGIEDDVIDNLTILFTKK